MSYDRTKAKISCLGEVMDNKKDLLIASAARLYSIGIDLEAARDRLRQLVGQGVPYNSEEMKQAVRDFKELERQWKALEREYLRLRDEMTKIDNKGIKSF